MMDSSQADGTPRPRRIAPQAYLSTSAEQTVAFGRLLGGMLAAGDVIVLTGDLGAGKTQLTKGIAAAMGVTGDVTSPTFTIEMIYEGAERPLHHFDLYRLEHADELEDTGLFDALDGDGPCVIEWGEQFADELGDERLDVVITRDDVGACEGVGEPARHIALVGRGVRGRALAAAVDGAMRDA